MRYAVALPLSFLLSLPTAPALAQQKVDCGKDLKKAVELIDDMWSFKLFKPGAVDFEDAYRRLGPEAKRSNTPEACADIIERFMAHLQDGHSHLGYYPDRELSAPYIIVRSQRERLTQTPGSSPPVHAYVFDRDTLDEKLRAIPRGSEILSVDGMRVDSLYRWLEKRVSGSTLQWRDYLSDRRLLSGPPGSEFDLTYRDTRGNATTVTLTRPADPDSIPDEISGEIKVWLGEISLSRWKRLEGGWGYIKYTSFIHGSLRHTVGRFDEYVDSLLNAPGLIIDLRGNGGGAVVARTEMAGRFVREKAPLTYLQIRQFGENYVELLYDPTTGGPSTKVPILVKPREPIYTGAVVVLIDRGCFSACEAFTGGLKALGRVLVIGPESSGGGSGWVGGLKLPSGATITFSWTVGWLPGGQQIEGHGVAPDIKVRERPVDWAVGRDRVLERAIRALEEGEAKPLAASSGT